MKNHWNAYPCNIHNNKGNDVSNSGISSFMYNSLCRFIVYVNHCLVGLWGGFAVYQGTECQNNFGTPRIGIVLSQETERNTMIGT